MFQTRLGLWLAAALFLVSGFALGGQQSAQPATLRPQMRLDPAAGQSSANPFAGQAEAVQAGKKLFKRHCAECHAEAARRESKAPDLNSPAIRNLSSETIFSILKNGKLRKGMPSWSRLPDERLWQLVRYLKSLPQNTPAP